MSKATRAHQNLHVTTTFALGANEGFGDGDAGDGIRARWARPTVDFPPLSLAWTVSTPRIRAKMPPRSICGSVAQRAMTSANSASAVTGRHCATDAFAAPDVRCCCLSAESE